MPRWVCMPEILPPRAGMCIGGRTCASRPVADRNARFPREPSDLPWTDKAKQDVFVDKVLSASGGDLWTGVLKSDLLACGTDRLQPLPHGHLPS